MLMRVKQVAEQLGVCGKTVKLAIRRKHLRAVQLGRGKQSPYLVDTDDVKSWLASREVSAKGARSW